MLKTIALLLLAADFGLYLGARAWYRMDPRGVGPLIACMTIGAVIAVLLASTWLRKQVTPVAPPRAESRGSPAQTIPWAGIILIVCGQFALWLPRLISDANASDPNPGPYPLAVPALGLLAGLVMVGIGSIREARGWYAKEPLAHGRLGHLAEGLREPVRNMMIASMILVGALSVLFVCVTLLMVSDHSPDAPRPGDVRVRIVSGSILGLLMIVGGFGIGLRRRWGRTFGRWACLAWFLLPATILFSEPTDNAAGNPSATVHHGALLAKLIIWGMWGLIGCWAPAWLLRWSFAEPAVTRRDPAPPSP